MLTPDGQPAEKMDKIMLLSSWERTLKEESLENSESDDIMPYIAAGMGKPTYPVDLNTISFHLAYWKNIETIANLAMQNLDEVIEGAAIDYGDPQGDKEARAIMAGAMSAWYQTEIKANNVLFTAGGAGAIRTIFQTLNERYRDIPGYRVITPFPHYTLYADNQHRLHPVDVMNAPGYHLTAEALEASIKSAIELGKKDGGHPKAVLICNPSNPLGTIIPEGELLQIAEVLRQYPDLHIVFDEAYAEMCYKDMPSLLQLAPDLKERIIIMRSATKGLSAAGERMAITMSFDPKITSELLAKNISQMGHSPRSSQLAYANTMAVFNGEEREKRIDFYKEKVSYVFERLKNMGASMPDPKYQVEATFYVLADLSDLFGLELPGESKRALGKQGLVSTDEELAYYLLFKDKLMIAPLSYYGLPDDKGFMRFTCSGAKKELTEMMDRVENRLLQARLGRQQALIETIRSRLERLQPINQTLHAEISKKINQLSGNEKRDCLALKESNGSLAQILSTIQANLKKSSGHLSPFFQKPLQQKEGSTTQALKSEWTTFVNTLFTEPCMMKSMLLNASEVDKLKFTPWVDYLKNHNKESQNSSRFNNPL